MCGTCRVNPVLTITFRVTLTRLEVLSLCSSIGAVATKCLLTSLVKKEKVSLKVAFTWPNKEKGQRQKKAVLFLVATKQCLCSGQMYSTFGCTSRPSNVKQFLVKLRTSFLEAAFGKLVILHRIRRPKIYVGYSASP